MRWSAVVMLAIAGLGACLGAALVDQNNNPGNGQDPTPQRMRATPAINQQDVIALEPVRAPEKLGATAFDYVRTLVSYGPRYSGMPGWSKQLTFITETLKKHGLEVKRDTWTDRRELITFTNLSATIPGKSKRRIVLACHHDTKCTAKHENPKHNFHFVGANDGASAVALLLALAPVLKATEREATIELVFFDGEESLDWDWNEGVRALFGSKRFAKKHRDNVLLGNEERIEALILLDMVGRTHLHIQEELYSTRRMRKIAWSAAVASGHELNFFNAAEAAADDHQPFLEVGIPSIDLIDLTGNPTWHKPTDTIENMSPDSIQKVADVVLTMLPEVERAYILRRD